jgi:hypothetical protein
MSDKAEIIPLHAADQDMSYEQARQRLTNLLIRYTLIDSFFRFTSEGKTYPFPHAEQLLPQTVRRHAEHAQQNAVLLVLIDGQLPRPLNKHFRLRASNRVTWRNIQRLAPDLDLSDFEAAHCRLDQPGLDTLLARLLPLDYALLAGREPLDDRSNKAALALTHMHVKVERLTDNAIKDLGRELGLIERRLFERGEDFVEELEIKYFEYYGFSANSSGRKSAAAMAAQLLKQHGERFTVFVAGQEDSRLTLLDDGDDILQHMLIRLNDAELAALRATLATLGIEDLSPYSVVGGSDGPTCVLYRLRLSRTAAARTRSRASRDARMRASWLAISEETILPRPGMDAPEIPFRWSRKRAAD